MPSCTARETACLPGECSPSAPPVSGFCCVWLHPCPFSSACGGWPALGILAFTILFYNGLYTPLKDRFLLVLLPGAAAGAAPPVLGWVCGGGAMYQPVPLMLFLLFFLWQIPHFWLAAERSSPDYETAGIPVPWRIFGSIAVWPDFRPLGRRLLRDAPGPARLRVRALRRRTVGFCRFSHRSPGRALFPDSAPIPVPQS